MTLEPIETLLLVTVRKTTWYIATEIVVAIYVVNRPESGCKNGDSVIQVRSMVSGDRTSTRQIRTNMFFAGLMKSWAKRRTDFVARSRKSPPFSWYPKRAKLSEVLTTCACQHPDMAPSKDPWRIERNSLKRASARYLTGNPTGFNSRGSLRWEMKWVDYLISGVATVYRVESGLSTQNFGPSRSSWILLRIYPFLWRLHRALFSLPLWNHRCCSGLLCTGIPCSRIRIS